MQTFLSANGLKLILRSHEGPDARDRREDMAQVLTGYALDHDTAGRSHVRVYLCARVHVRVFGEGNLRIALRKFLYPITSLLPRVLAPQLDHNPSSFHPHPHPPHAPPCQLAHPPLKCCLHVTTAGKLMTVFSAPDYPQFMSSHERRYNNSGACAVLSGARPVGSTAMPTIVWTCGFSLGGRGERGEAEHATPWACTVHLVSSRWPPPSELPSWLMPPGLMQNDSQGWLVLFSIGMV